MLQTENSSMNREHRCYVYIMQSVSRRVLYIGVTSNIEKRVFEHKNHFIDGFSAKYNTTRLVLLERYSDIRTAISREKQLKRWNRAKKEWLIELSNPHWEDLAEDWGKSLVETKGGSTPGER
jgi:putative endonuclease